MSMWSVRLALILSALSFACMTHMPAAAGQPPRAALPATGQPPSPKRGPTKVAEDAAEPQLRQLAALLSDRCLVCHGPEKQEGNYSVANLARLRTPGDSQRKPIEAGKPEHSELVRRLKTTDPSERMPAEADPLNPAEIALVEAWIAAGAKAPKRLEAAELSQWRAPVAAQSAPDRYPTALPISALAIVGDGQSVIASGYGEVTQWDIPSGKLLRRRPVAGTQVADIEVNLDDRFVAVSSGVPGSQGIVEVWRLDGGPDARPIWSATTPDVAADIAFAPNRPRLAVGHNDGSLVVVDLGQPNPDGQFDAQTFTPHADAILAVAWSSSGDRLITGSRDRTAKIFDARQMDLIANYDRHERAVGGVAYCGDNPVSFDETGQLRLWTGDDNDRTIAERSNLPRFLEHIAAAGQRVFVPDGPAVLVMEAQRKTVDDGQDDKGKPKTKKVTRWIQTQRLSTSGQSWVLCVATRNALTAAGTETGEIVLWTDKGENPQGQFKAVPK